MPRTCGRASTRSPTTRTRWLRTRPRGCAASSVRSRRYWIGSRTSARRPGLVELVLLVGPERRREDDVEDEPEPAVELRLDAELALRALDPLCGVDGRDDRRDDDQRP